MFFPLTDPQGGAWFDDVYDLPSDAFLASFCINGILTDVESREGTAETFSAYVGDFDNLVVRGLPTGMYIAQLFDTTGKLITERTAMSNGSVFTANIPSIETGVYIVNIQGFGARAIFIR